MATAAAVAVVLLVIAVAAIVSSGRAPAATASASPSPSASPTATRLGTWRVQGTITDQEIHPVEGVCIGVGPAVCTPTNPRTDAQGHWFIDFPAVEVEYDLHFTKEGYEPVATHVRLTGPQILGVVISH